LGQKTCFALLLHLFSKRFAYCFEKQIKNNRVGFHFLAPGMSNSFVVFSEGRSAFSHSTRLLNSFIMICCALLWHRRQFSASMFLLCFRKHLRQSALVVADPAQGPKKVVYKRKVSETISVDSYLPYGAPVEWETADGKHRMYVGGKKASPQIHRISIWLAVKGSHGSARIKTHGGGVEGRFQNIMKTYDLQHSCATRIQNATNRTRLFLTGSVGSTMEFHVSFAICSNTFALYEFKNNNYKCILNKIDEFKMQQLQFGV